MAFSILIMCLAIYSVLLVFLPSAPIAPCENCKEILVEFRKTLKLPSFAEDTDTTGTDYIFNSEESTRPGPNKLNQRYYCGNGRYMDLVLDLVGAKNNTKAKLKMEMVIFEKLHHGGFRWSSFLSKITKPELTTTYIFYAFHFITPVLMVLYTCWGVRNTGREGRVFKSGVYKGVMYNNLTYPASLFAAHPEFVV